MHRILVAAAAVLVFSGAAHGQDEDPPPFIIYDDGLTRTNVGSTDTAIILRDNPNPPPNPTTVILLDGFVNTAGIRFHYTLEGSSLLENRGGELTDGDFGGSVDLKDTSRLIMSGGSIRQDSFSDRDPAINAGGSSRTEISGGTVSVFGASFEGGNGPAIFLAENAELHITGGAFRAAGSTGIILANDSAQVRIEGGTFSAEGTTEFMLNRILFALDSSIVDILGGSFSSDERGILATDDAIINIRGGDFDFPLDAFTASGFSAGRNARMNIFGDNFALDGMPVGPGLIPNNGILTGVLADGSQLEVRVTGRVFLIPEPANFALAFAVAAASLRPRRRSQSDDAVSP